MGLVPLLLTPSYQRAGDGRGCCHGEITNCVSYLIFLSLPLRESYLLKNKYLSVIDSAGSRIERTRCQKCIAACCANIPLTIDRYFGLSIADIPFDDDVTEFPEAADSSHVSAVSRLFRHRLLALSIEALRQRTAAHHLVTHL